MAQSEKANGVGKLPSYPIDISFCSSGIGDIQLKFNLK
jgi:hypothetical protein